MRVKPWVIRASITALRLLVMVIVLVTFAVKVIVMLMMFKQLVKHCDLILSESWGY